MPCVWQAQLNGRRTTFKFCSGIVRVYDLVQILGPDVWVPSPIKTPHSDYALVGTLLKSMEGDLKLPLNGLKVTQMSTLSAD